MVTDVVHDLQKKYLPDCPTLLQVTDRAVAPGDAVYIYYTGYLDGVAFDGGSNVSQSVPSRLEIGSGQFIPGFEEGLVGVRPADTAIERRTSGEITADDVILFSYNLTDTAADGTTTEENRANVRVDLSDPATDERYGEGFSARLIGAQLGQQLSFTLVEGAGDQGGRTYEGVVSLAVRTRGVTVSATFPTPYPNNRDLAGRTATFEVVVSYIEEEVYPDPDADFVAAVGFEAQTDDPVAEFLSAVRADLADEREEQKTADIRSAVFALLCERAEVIAWPAGSVEFFYDRQLADITAEFNQANQYYLIYYGYSPFETVGDYILAAYGVTDETDGLAFLRRECEQIVLENLVLLRVARARGFTVTDEDVRAYAAEVAAYYNAYYNTDTITVADVIEQYGTERLISRVLFSMVLDALVPAATVIYE
ncbi:MAG: FKBP-type peptidyl-prolyl cis-trans isomerase [Clostridia bacterium]|nr:FKBP-type peptidyl-prolyl cis-trans isomerase [Clostridia bacterium]